MSITAVADPTEPEPEPGQPHVHEHLHLFADGLRFLVHWHAYPTAEWPMDPLGTRAHRHMNGRHSHPHGHDDYRPLPLGAERRPIIPQPIPDR